jgi:hypothetical protein
MDSETILDHFGDLPDAREDNRRHLRINPQTLYGEYTTTYWQHYRLWRQILSRPSSSCSDPPLRKHSFGCCCEKAITSRRTARG